MALAQQLLADQYVHADLAAADLDHGRVVGVSSGAAEQVEDLAGEVAWSPPVFRTL
jgi:hypothetical protein